MIPAHITQILIVSGLLTAGAILLTLAPRQVSRAVFHLDPVDWLSNFFTRYVGLLVFLIGSLIAYSALHPEIRRPVLVAAILEKTFFVGFIFSMRPDQRTPLAVIAAAADTLFVLLYLMYLFLPH